MAEEQQGFGISGTTIASVLAAALLTLFYGQHLLLQDRRPTVEPSSTRAPSLQQIDARLWEDPLFAAQHFVDGDGGKETDMSACTKIDNGPPTGTLIVILPGGPYEQAAETRRRTRYAVVSALHGEGYDPVDAEHLGCFRSVLTAPGGAAASPIPFEAFTGSAGARVSVAWLDENRLRGEPGRYYDVLSQTQKDFRAALGVAPSSEPTIRIIGPYSSRVLIDLAKAQKQTHGKTFEIFNYAATIDLAEAENGLAFHQDGCPSGARPAGSGVWYCQVVHTDDSLAGLLADEVAHRTSMLGLPGPKRVAMIYESDTVYGTKLSQSVAREMMAAGVSTDPCPADFQRGAFARWSQQPLVRAILLPLSSIGGSALLQQFLVP